MEGVSLLESGTNRHHFAFLKKYEACKSAKQADELIIGTIQEVESSLQTKSIIGTNSPAAQLVLLVHCIDLFPCTSSDKTSRPSIYFALVPALQLAATATKIKDLWLSYNVLGRIFASLSAEEQRETSLLLLNTLRQHLEAGAGYLAASGDSTSSRSSIKNHNQRSGLATASLALRSVINGVPSGPDIFPALYGPVSTLCDVADEGVQSLSLEALAKIFSYIEFDEGLAKAIWERAKGVLKRIVLVELSLKGSALPLAILRAAARAHQRHVITTDQLVDVCLQLTKRSASAAVITTALHVVLDSVKDGALSPAQVDRVRSAAVQAGVEHSDDYALLLSVCETLGQIAAQHGQNLNPGDLVAVWNLIKTHLNAKNANRKILAIKALKAFLPFKWFEVGNASSLELSEMEMGLVMDMLGDRDDNVRLQALSLIYRVDPGLLNDHCARLVEICQKELDPMKLKAQFQHRAIEAIALRFLQEQKVAAARVFTRDLCIILCGCADPDRIDQEAIAMIMKCIRRAGSALGSLILLEITRNVGKSQSVPSSTTVVLCATLACERDCTGAEGEDILSHLCQCLRKVSNAVPLEAVLIAIVKVASSVRRIDGNSLAEVELLQNHSSGTIQQRVKQIEQIRQGHKGGMMIASGSLLDVMNRIDKAFLTEASSSKAPDVRMNSPPNKAVRPLRYDAYKDEQASRSPTMSISSSVPFQALPEPSRKADERSRKQRKKLERQVHDDMQQSIARLTLGTANSEDEEANNDEMLARGPFDKDANLI